MFPSVLIGSTLLELEGSVIEDSLALDVDEHTKFSVWVSFCEIYNENIHDLLEPVPSGPGGRRSILRLSQDVKGNSFVKGDIHFNSLDIDLGWNRPLKALEEACQVAIPSRNNIILQLV